MSASLLDLLLPDECVLCATMLPARPTHLFCIPCLDAMPTNRICCARCAFPLPEPGLCTECTGVDTPMPIARTLVPNLHEGAARDLIHRFKYQRDLRAGQSLAHLLVQRIVPAYSYDKKPQLLIPVPMPWLRRVHRGFDHAAWLAGYCARRLGRKAHTSGLYRRRATPQARLSNNRRRRMPDNTFRIRSTPPAQHIAIIDDVMTTGTTVRILAGALRRAGIERVDVWCLTRAVLVK